MANFEERKAKMAEYEAIANEKVQEYNALLLEGKYDEKIDGEIAKAVKDYTDLARSIAFTECSEAENPMHEACKRWDFDTIKIAERPAEEGSKIKVREVVPAKKHIDLKKLMKFCKAQKIQLGEDPNWVYEIEQFNLRLTMRSCKRWGIDSKKVSDSYYMNKLSREIDLGSNPVSNTQILKTLTRIIGKMIGEEYKPTSHDVKRLVDVYATADNAKALKAKVANHNQMRKYMQAICHRLLTDGSYEIVYKEIKK